jgi:hypothetical protein
MFALRFALATAITACLYPAIVLATTCTPSNLSPAICHPAHAVAPKQLPSGGDCALDMMSVCSATTGTRCLNRYAQAVAGECELKLNYSNPTYCVWDSGVTTVDLPYYMAACSSASGVCQCEYTLDSMTTPSQVQVCDCDEFAL